MSDPWDFGEVDRIVARTGTGREAVLPILRQIQERYHYLPEEALKRICEKTEITPAGIVGVATFYKRFRHRPAGRHRISVCAGTACHVKGADLVDEEIRRRLRLEPGSDTDAEREFTLERVGCLGCCTLAPVVRLDEVTHGHVTPASAGPMLEDFLRRRASGGLREEADGSPERGPSAGVEIRIGQGSCCLAGGAFEVRRSLERAAAEWGADVRIKPVGCVGMCHQIPLVEVVDGTGASTLYTRVRPETAVGLLARHVRPRGIWGRTRARLFMWLHRFARGGDGEPDARFSAEVRDPQICEFLGPQKRIATEHSGQGDPLSVEDYERHGGFQAL
ncbi:MAG: NAD(P)H-dependent oxidoreductase subunit E, partial [Planctomycetota bacterium]